MSPDTAFDIARGLLDLFFRLVPPADRQRLIDEAAQRRALAAGEVADDLKYGPNG